MSTYAVYEATGAGALRRAERDLRSPAAGEVRVRVEACGICRSDTLTVDAPPHDHPFVPGHEIVGRVDATGDGVTGLAPGDRVGVGFLNGHCGICTSCRRGRYTSCTQQQHTGLTTDGGYAEVVYARASGIVRIPAGLDALDAAPLICAGLTVYNALARVSTRPGALIAVQGIGGLGHLAVQYAAAAGYRVAAVSRGPEKAKAVRAFGAEYYIDASVTDPGRALAELGGAAAVITTAAGPDPEGTLLRGLEPAGQFVVVGAEGPALGLPTVDLLFGSRTVQGTLTGSSIDNEDNLGFAVRSGIRSQNEIYPLAEAPAAYARMASGGARYRVVLDATR